MLFEYTIIYNYVLVYFKIQLFFGLTYFSPKPKKMSNQVLPVKLKVCNIPL